MFARTQRLTLRPGWPEDAPALAAAIAHKDVVTKISRAPWPYTEDDARAFLTRRQASADSALLITTLDTGTPRIIGCIGIHPEGDAHELGYWLTPDAWGRGYATEAGQHMVQIARHALGLKRLRAGHYVDNPASGRVLSKLGFTPTGRIEPQYCRARGHEVLCVKLELDLDIARGDFRLAA
ncbi:GNAT family N-acetyltransferase [Sphingomonas psychrolutea]|uniref:N-acetyltransferase n=1 Tax=Sphingomonas psychrolutea TaxID=1259676 RepID=A0ABQ1GZA3_9SPHN|nr:GNAT family N-acetyltransferase [Sphingomonas psychrolutea]GGA53489.1 N-acetyltransferase [Sphingomonas psychrolutea]